MCFCLRSVRGFYGAFIEKALKTFPLANTLLKDMVVLSPTERPNISSESGIKTIDYCSCPHVVCFLNFSVRVFSM